MASMTLFTMMVAPALSTGWTTVPFTLDVLKKI